MNKELQKHQKEIHDALCMISWEAMKARTDMANAINDFCHKFKRLESVKKTARALMTADPDSLHTEFMHIFETRPAEDAIDEIRKRTQE